ncbi:hypothetical protein QFZ74_004565 [Streptomyces sp. V3I7]|nr:hypothetical protein [Streptomyces sp. V3I7]
MRRNGRCDTGELRAGVLLNAFNYGRTLLP